MASKINKNYRAINGSSKVSEPSFTSSEVDRIISNINRQYSNMPKFIDILDCDMAIFNEFNMRFKVKDKFQPLINLDSELASLPNQNYLQYDKNKEYLNGPFFTIFRTANRTKFRSNLATKELIHARAFNTENGIVIEETLASPPMYYDLVYELKFISNYREYLNEFEQQFRNYFRNRRNIIEVEGYRFSVGPEDYDEMFTFEVLNREAVDSRTFYVLTVNLIFETFYREKESIIKRLRPNKLNLSLYLKEKNGTESLQSQVNINLPFPKSLE